MEKQYKTGRFDGQPEWMPDCKMVYMKGNLSKEPYFVANLPGCFIFYNESGEVCDSGYIFHDYLYEYIYETGLQPLDVVAFWKKRNKHISDVLLYSSLSEDDFLEYDRVVFVPENMHYEDSIKVSVWEEHIKEGRVEVIK